jgi:hypothetical protein
VFNGKSPLQNNEVNEKTQPAECKNISKQNYLPPVSEEDRYIYPVERNI